MLEAAISLLVLLLSTTLAVEVTRRAYFELTFHHFVFLAARERAFRSHVPSGAREFLEKALGPKILRVQHGMELGEGRSFRYRTYYRYPAFASFPWRTGRKHHFEVVRECQFPLLSD